MFELIAQVKTCKAFPMRNWFPFAAWRSFCRTLLIQWYPRMFLIIQTNKKHHYLCIYQQQHLVQKINTLKTCRNRIRGKHISIHRIHLHKFQFHRGKYNIKTTHSMLLNKQQHDWILPCSWNNHHILASNSYVEIMHAKVFSESIQHWE